MGNAAGQLVRRIFRIGVALVPWTIALYLHYWLEHGGIWEVDMPFRALISGALIAVGMGLSFLLNSWLVRPRGD